MEAIMSETHLLSTMLTYTFKRLPSQFPLDLGRRKQPLTGPDSVYSIFVLLMVETGLSKLKRQFGQEKKMKTLRIYFLKKKNAGKKTFSSKSSASLNNGFLINILHGLNLENVFGNLH